MTSKQFVRDTAMALNKSGRKMNGQQLAARLNRRNIKTSYGSSYSGGRGTYMLIHHTYYWLDGQGLSNEAKIVADVFVNAEGNPAWDK